MALRHDRLAWSTLAVGLSTAVLGIVGPLLTLTSVALSDGRGNLLYTNASTGWSGSADYGSDGGFASPYDPPPYGLVMLLAATLVLLGSFGALRPASRSWATGVAGAGGAVIAATGLTIWLARRSGADNFATLIGADRGQGWSATGELGPGGVLVLVAGVGGLAMLARTLRPVRPDAVAAPDVLRDLSTPEDGEPEPSEAMTLDSWREPASGLALEQQWGAPGPDLPHPPDRGSYARPPQDPAPGDPAGDDPEQDARRSTDRGSYARPEGPGPPAG